VAAEFWINGVGQNMLAGIPGDEANPAFLTNAYILDFLTHDPNARASFDRLYPTMTADEQTRLDEIVKMAENGLVVDDVTTADRFQHRLNTGGVHRGGGWMPRPFRG
jgi:hypothetical protein